MIKCGNWPIGVCSWSLQQDITSIAESMRKLGTDHIHLAVRPALQQGGDDYLAEVRRQNWTISATMIDFPQEDYSTLETIKLTGGIVPDDCWPQNQKLFEQAVDVTAELGVRFLSMHAGFIDHNDHDYAAKFYNRIGCLADIASGKNVTLLMETGQETAEDLRRLLEKLSHPAIAVNFDPANMILYDKGDPVEAVKVLEKWVRHIHIKDAIRTTKPGTWGTEVPWGSGEVVPQRFLQVLKKTGFDGGLAIEREAGDDRLGDIRQAVEKLRLFSTGT